MENPYRVVTEHAFYMFLYQKTYNLFEYAPAFGTTLMKYIWTHTMYKYPQIEFLFNIWESF